MTKKPKTIPISEDSIRRRLHKNSDNRTSTEKLVNQDKSFKLDIRGIPIVMAISSDKPLYLGRFNINNQPQVDIDLLPYGGDRYGVSRVHARINLHNNQIYITDLDSTNGTLLAGRRLIPHFARLIHHQDKIVLGTLLTTIYLDWGD